MNNSYEANSIKTLDYFEHIRQYPGMYIGSKDLQGLHHCAKEIISNSIDEYLNGAGDTIIIKIQQDGGLYIKDNGRGIPHGKHESGCSTLQACYGIANTGGKFDNATGQTGYNTSGGEHGTGGKAVNALSKKMIVSTSRDGVKEVVEFSKGKFISYRTEGTTETGVEVLFYPDETIFETVKFDSDKLKNMIQEFSFLCTGLTFHFIDENKSINEVFYSSQGLYDYLNYLSKGEDLLTNPIYFSEKEGSFQVEVALAYTKSYSNLVKLYTNNIPQEKGTHLTGFKTAFTQVFNQFAKDKKWLKDSESNLTGGDLEEGQILIINFKMIDPVFKGQNKEELSSSEGRTYVQRLSANALKEYFIAHEKEIKIIFDKAIAARKAREAAKKARDIVRNSGKKEKGLKAKMQLSDKFIDCKSKNPEERNLLLVEGLSAGSSAIEARNVNTDCIYMLRGKTISPLKTAIDKILANQEMSDIIKVIGAGFNQDFDVNKMNFDKIVITSDQDSDGLDIELLLITFFYTYMRPLVEAGKLYRAVTPLYIVKQKNEDIYFYTDNEYAEWAKTASGKEEVLRAKGLGELSAEQLHKVCFENQRFKRITISDAEKTSELLEILMGKKIEPRKQYIYDNATELGFNFM
jgi:DNA gyrase subunit B